MRIEQAATWLLTVALASGPELVWANGLRLASQDGFATGRGEAFVATADNPSAIYYNPAGLSQLQGHQVRGGLYAICYEPSFVPPPGRLNSGTTYRSTDRRAVAPNLFYAYGWPQGPCSFGLGAYAPYGGRISWPQDTGFRTVALSSSLRYLTLNPVMALKLAPGLSIGGGIMVNFADMELEQGLRPAWQPPNTNFFRFKADGWSAGYNLGLLWQPHPKLALGATFRSQTTVGLNGRTEFEQYTLGVPFSRRPAQADFEFPLTTVVGVSYRPTPRWNLEFNADYTDWGSFGTVTLRQQGPLPLGWPQNPDVTLNWQPSWLYAFGVTRYFDNGWHVSGGYAFNRNSVPDAYYTPLAADLDRHFFSLGLGRRSKRLGFDVAYQFGYGPAHTVTGSQPPSLSGVFAGQNADGTYRFRSHGLLVSVGWRF